MGNQEEKSTNSPGRPHGGPCGDMIFTRWFCRDLPEIGLEVMGVDEASPHNHSVLFIGPKLFPVLYFLVTCPDFHDFNTLLLGRK